MKDSFGLQVFDLGDDETVEKLVDLETTVPQSFGDLA